MTTTTTPTAPVPGWKIVLFILVILGGGFAQYKYDVLTTVRNALPIAALHTSAPVSPVVPAPVPPKKS